MLTLQALLATLSVFIFGVGVLFVNAGRAITTNRLRAGGTEPLYIHWGTGATDPVGGDTALQTPGTESRVAGTSSQQTTTTSNDTYQVTGSLTCNATGKTISEAGLFDASTSGNLFMRGTFTGIPVVQNDSIAFTMKVAYA
jgi:hypothetical protein